MYERNQMMCMERPRSSRIPMDRQRRAKQFAPFQALKGFEHALQEEAVRYDFPDLKAREEPGDKLY